jgi:nitroimidazol reductase NimA-like FMN-containing flavoprotein (pyridoxamine 5'-phosphate oxidase superfamily)
MGIHDVTEEQRDKMIETMIKMLGRERIQPSKEELEKEIIDYISKKQPCTLCTCSKDGIPRATVLDYRNDGLTLYIMTEGGAKLKNLEENNKVGVGIGTSSQAMGSVRGVNMSGVAEVFTDDQPGFAEGLRAFKPVLDNIEKTTGKAPKLPKGVMKLIRIKPSKMVYFHYNKGIGNAIWEA